MATETTFVDNEEELDEQEIEDEKEIEDQFPIPKKPEPKEDVKEEPKKGPVKKFFGWVGDKIRKARKNPVVTGIAGLAVGIGGTLGVQALANHFGKDEEPEDEIETEFSEPIQLDEPEDFIPDEVEEVTEEPAEAVTEEV